MVTLPHHSLPIILPQSPPFSILLFLQFFAVEVVCYSTIRVFHRFFFLEGKMIIVDSHGDYSIYGTAISRLSFYFLDENCDYCYAFLEILDKII